MKGMAMFIVIIIICSLFSPVLLNGAVAQGDGVDTIMTLDVCHATASMHADFAEMPAIAMDTCSLCGPVFAGYIVSERTPIPLSSFDVSLEEPPRFAV